MNFLFILSESSLYSRLHIESGRYKSYAAAFRRTVTNASVRNVIRFRPSRTGTISAVLRDDEIIECFRFAAANGMINPLYSDHLRLGRMYEQFYLDIFSRYAIDCIVMHNTSFAYQWIGAALARRQGIRTLITERGYFLPFTATMEPIGVNALSMMRRWDRSRPVNPEWTSAFRAFYEEYRQTYQGPTSTGRRWSSLRSHAIDRWIDTERYPLRLVPRAVKALWKVRSGMYRNSNEISGPKVVFFVSSIFDPQHPFPASRYVEERCRVVFEGWKLFRAEHPQYTLIVKEHPADDKLVLLPVLKACTAGHGVCFSTEEAGSLIEASDIVITINSGVGIEALCRYKSMICMGDALYNHEGLALQFPPKGDHEAFSALLKVAASYTPDTGAVDAFLAELFATVQFVIDRKDETQEEMTSRFYEKAEALLSA